MKIRNINEKFGVTVEFDGDTEEMAVERMAEAIRACGPEYLVTSDDLIEGVDYEVI
ncbi:MAG TPA: hypothetical protein VJ553_02205 [Candidatus Paceibacterota bacterium]|nr:hypothetical protein [Candidatus Paceibacterota bacterium]